MRIALVLLIALLNVSCTYIFGRTIQARVVDGEGNPVENAEVGMGFLRENTGDSRSGFTDSRGRFSGRGWDDYGVRVQVEKEGYYDSEIGSRVGGTGNRNIKIELRKKKTPIPMYVKKVNLAIPEQRKRIGFDLVNADWIPPFGEGEKSHIYFKYSGYYEHALELNGEVVIEIPEGGFIQVTHRDTWSTYRFPYQAPEDGYEPIIVHKIYRKDGKAPGTNVWKSTLNKNIEGYLIKVVVGDGGGYLEKGAYFGKILGEFRFAPMSEEDDGAPAFIEFTYYLNPSEGDRNIEFDPSRNLFKNEKRYYAP